MRSLRSIGAGLLMLFASLFLVGATPGEAKAYHYRWFGRYHYPYYNYGYYSPYRAYSPYRSAYYNRYPYYTWSRAYPWGWYW